MKIFTFLAATVLLAGISISDFNAIHPPASEKEKWLQDLDTLVYLLKEKHVNAYWLQNEVALDKLVKETRAKIAATDETKLDKDIITADFARLVASLGDGHSRLLFNDPHGAATSNFNILPISMTWFSDGLYIYAVAEQYRHLLGGKILKVNGLEIEKAYAKLKPYVSASHEYGKWSFSPDYFRNMNLLYGIGLANSKDKLALEVQTLDEKKVISDLQSIPSSEGNLVNVVRYDELDDRPLPFYRRDREKNYWFEYLPDQKVLYVQYRAVANMPEENVENFAKRLFQFVNENEINKFVLDLRNNGGGNNYLNLPLLVGIQQNAKINQPGKLFTIIGKNTFSAAICFASDLEMKTNTILVGEPVGDYPNHPGDANMFVLPNSKLMVRLSALFWLNSFDQDKRVYIQPDLPVSIDFKDYAQKKDPVLDAVLNYKPSITVVAQPVRSLEVYTGSYWFTKEKALTITNNNGKLQMEITGKVFSDLYPKNNNTFTTEIKDLLLTFDKNGALTFQYPNGSKKVLIRKKWDEGAALEYIYKGDIEKAKTAYLQAKQADPKAPALAGNNMSMLATYIFYATHDIDKGIALLEIANTLNPESGMAQRVLAGARRIKEGKK